MKWGYSQAIANGAGQMHFSYMYGNRGITRFTIKEFEASFPDSDTFIELQSDYYETWYYRGRSKMELRDFQGAILDFNCALELNPGMGEIYGHRVAAHGETEEFSKSIADYTSAISFYAFINDNANLFVMYHLRGMACLYSTGFNQAILKQMKFHSVLE